MIKILLLGGTQEGKQLAEQLATYPQIELIYSTARKVPKPAADYTTIYGGFGGANGLTKKLKNENFHLLLDMTYPYAAQMSQNAAIAAQLSHTKIWRYQRPAWTAQPDDRWFFYSTLAEIISAIKPYQRCFFSLGNNLPNDMQTTPAYQQWFIRCRSKQRQKRAPQKTYLEGQGPFSFEEELKLLKALQIDSLITYDSGGDAAKTKIEAARTASIPVFFISRPTPPQAGRKFGDIDSIEKALVSDYCLNVA